MSMPVSQQSSQKEPRILKRSSGEWIRRDHQKQENETPRFFHHGLLQPFQSESTITSRPSIPTPILTCVQHEVVTRHDRPDGRRPVLLLVVAPASGASGVVAPSARTFFKQLNGTSFFIKNFYTKVV